MPHVHVHAHAATCSRAHTPTLEACSCRHLVDDGKDYQVKVLDECIPGSTISSSSNSETKMANAIRIQIGGRDCLLIDTPGFCDTDGDIDKIVNAASIARVVSVCTSLRLVLLINQSDIANSRLMGFSELASTVSKLFTDFEPASEALAIWVNKKPTDGEVDEKRLKKKLKEAAKDKNNEEARALLKLLVTQLDRQPLRIIKYTKAGLGVESSDSDSDSGEEVPTPVVKSAADPTSADSPSSDTQPPVKRRRVRELAGAEPMDSGDDSEELEEVEQIAFEVAAYLRQLQGITPLDRPSELVRLPLGSSGKEHLRSLAREVRDRCEAAAEVPDFALAARGLQLLKDIEACFKGSEPGLPEDGAQPTLARDVQEATHVVSGEYSLAVNKIKARVIEQVVLRMGVLRSALSESQLNSMLEVDALHGFAWARRCIGAAGAIAEHVESLPVEDALLKSAQQLLIGLRDSTLLLEVSNPGVKVSLVKLRQIADYFNECARPCLEGDAADPIFTAVYDNAVAAHAHVVGALRQKLEQLTTDAADHVDHGCAGVMSAMGQSVACLKASGEMTDASDFREATTRFEQAGTCLRVLREAQQCLGEMATELDGLFEQACDAISDRLQTCLARVKTFADDPDRRELELSMLVEMTAELTALDKARSSFKLREHFEPIDAAATGMSAEVLNGEAWAPAPRMANPLDMMYEQAIECVVTWHVRVTEPILEDAKLDDFAHRITGSNRADLETAKQLSDLGSCPSTGMDARLGERIQGTTAARQKELEQRVRGCLEIFTMEAVDAVTDLDNSRRTYADHRKNLALLEQAAWWDALTKDTTIGRAIDAMERAFQERLQRLASGPESIVVSLRNGQHQAAAADFNRMCEMAPLWANAHSPLAYGLASPLAPLAHGARASKAHVLKEIFEECVNSTQTFASSKIEQAEQGLLAEAKWSASEPPRVDKSVWDALRRADQFIDLATHIGALEQLQNAAALQRAGSMCKSRVEREFREMKERVVHLCDSISKGHAEQLTAAREKAMDVSEVLRVLYSRTSHPVLFEMLYDEGAGEYPDFLVLQTHLFRSVKMAHQTFPRLRLNDQQTLAQTLSEIEREMPASETMLSALKKDIADGEDRMRERHTSEIQKKQTEVTADFAKGSFTSSTFRKMRDLQHVGEDSEEFSDACAELMEGMQAQVKDVKTGILIMSLTSPEALSNFNTDDRIVAPWNNLQAALATNHHTFLETHHRVMQEAAAKGGTPSSEPFVPATAAALVIDELQARLKQSLDPHLMQFRQNELECAATNIQQISVLAESLRGGQELYQRAQHAIEEARSEQAEHLQKLASGEGLDSKNLKSYLSCQTQLLCQLDKLQRKAAPLQAEYQRTFKALVAHVSGAIEAKLEPVLGERWNQLRKDEHDLMSAQLSMINNWLQKQAPPAIVHELALEDHVLELAEQRLAARKKKFIVRNFDDKEPAEMAQIIGDHVSMPAEYADLVEKYRSGYVRACHDFIETGKLPPEQLPRGRQVSKKGLRIRAFIEFDTFDTLGPVDLQPFNECQESLSKGAEEMQFNIKNLIAQLENPAPNEGDLAKSLQNQLRIYVEVVRLAAAAIGITRRSAGSEVDAAFAWVRGNADLVLTQALEIFNAVFGMLKGLQEASMSPAQCPNDLVKMGAALRRLQMWEGMPGDEPIFTHITELEQLLQPKESGPSSSTSAPPAPSDPSASDLVKLLGTHSRRVQNAGTVICRQLDETVQLLNGQYDPDNDPALAREPFELALCGQMDELVNELAWQVEAVRSKRHSLQSRVAEMVTDFKNNFDKLLAGNQYKEADKALKGLKRFAFLMEMKEFEKCEGGRPAEYEAHLGKHADELRKRAVDSIPNSSSPEDLGPLLIQLKQIDDGIPAATRIAREAIRAVLLALQKKYPQGMNMLAATLKSLDPVLGNALVNSSDVFSSVRTMLFNERTQQKFDDVLASLEGEPSLDKPALQIKYEEFDERYQRDLQWALGHACTNPVEYLAQQANNRTRGDSSGAGPSNAVKRGIRAAAAFIGFTQNAQEEMPKVLAAIFALWTVQFYLKTKDPLSSSQETAMRRPHPVQVLCILRLLGAVDGSRIHLENHLAEVPTGEGKSLILAVTAAALGLYGYHVDCVCYSPSLSGRDHDAFAGLFAALNLEDPQSPKIRYGTFDQLSERLMTEKHGQVRQQMRDSLTGSKPTSQKAVQPPTRVLLIDEVDVFLDPEFFSGMYRPCLMITDERVAALMRAIWANPTRNPMEMDEYTALFKKPTILAKGYEWFAQSAVVQMQRAAQDFKKTPQQRGVDYELTDGWVEYRSQDALVRSDRMTYGYVTNCVYLHEHERGSIDEAQLLANGLHLHATCGEFSYALLPSTEAYSRSVPAFYKFILGVTGTLQEGKLPNEARAVLRDEIKIKHMTYCPSMYGALTRDWDPASKEHVRVTPSPSEHHIEITNEITKRLRPTDPAYKGKRAVLVFFESIEELERFYHSPQFKRFKDGANRLTEKTAKEEEERDSLVSKATRQGQITLATRSFGRGVDFVVDDEHMVTCGGLHVLLTFFPRDLQEEVQIKGRGARQGEKGSFSMVLLGQSLEDLAGNKATPDDIKTWVTNSELYLRMSEIRSDKTAADMDERLNKAEAAKKKHGEAATALNAFASRGDSKQLSALLRQYNFVGSSTTSRTLMLVDITYSMNSLIEKAKACIGTFFDRCQKVLDAEGIVSGFELAIAGFSNYNVSVDDILVRSTWEAKPHNLSLFLQDLTVRGGWGPEAIEVGLMHALVEHQKRPIDQIIIIGDAAANEPDQIPYKRDKGYHTPQLPTGGGYWDAQRPVWSPAGVPKKDAASVLLDIQATKPLPVHCYYMNRRARPSFEQLAAATGGGSAQFLDVNSDTGAQLLTDAVCKQILSSLGGKQLEDAYERMKPSFNH